MQSSASRWGVSTRCRISAQILTRGPPAETQDFHPHPGFTLRPPRSNAQLRKPNRAACQHPEENFEMAITDKQETIREEKNPDPPVRQRNKPAHSRICAERCIVSLRAGSVAGPGGWNRDSFSRIFALGSYNGVQHVSANGLEVVLERKSKFHSITFRECVDH